MKGGRQASMAADGVSYQRQDWEEVLSNVVLAVPVCPKSCADIIDESITIAKVWPERVSVCAQGAGATDGRTVDVVVTCEDVVCNDAFQAKLCDGGEFLPALLAKSRQHVDGSAPVPSRCFSVKGVREGYGDLGFLLVGETVPKQAQVRAVLGRGPSVFQKALQKRDRHL